MCSKRLPRHDLARAVWLACLICLNWLLAGCELPSLGSRLPPPGPDQPLVVGLLADSALQPADPQEGMIGFSHDLLTLFAAENGLRLETRTVADRPALLALLRQGKIHLAAALPYGRDLTDILLTAPLRENRALLVQRNGAAPIERLEELAGRRILVRADSPLAAFLRTLDVRPEPILIEQPIDDIELMRRLAEEGEDMLVASDELRFQIAARHHPNLTIAYALPEKLACGWGFAAVREPLFAQANRFIDEIKADGRLRQLDDRYFGHLRRIDGRALWAFYEHLRERLPRYRRHFHEAQRLTGIDWRLIAALAYQESQWDPLATSPTGVRGMMMLTEDTADRLGVDNRLDARASILAGARYLALLMESLPAEIKPPDRLWLALAAYNLGMGHLKGGRHFAAGLNKDPNLWVDMKEVLPLLARPEYYARLKSGRARGGEAVVMVENVRNYYEMLKRFEAPLPAGETTPKFSPRSLPSARG